jgi:hypothetical protein
VLQPNLVGRAAFQNEQATTWRVHQGDQQAAVTALQHAHVDRRARSRITPGLVSHHEVDQTPDIAGRQFGMLADHGQPGRHEVSRRQRNEGVTADASHVDDCRSTAVVCNFARP